MANEENRNSADFLREQDEKRQRAIREMQDLQNLLDYASGKAEKPKASAERPKAAPSAPKSEPKTEPQQDTVLMDKNVYQQAKEETRRQEERARRERIRRTSPAAKTADKTEGAPRPVRKVTREEAERRRKARKRRSMIRLGGLIVILLLIICAAACTIHKAANSPKDLGAAAGSADIAAGSAEPTGPVIDNSKPASEQETDQYLAVKNDPDAPDYAKSYPGLYSDALDTPFKESEEKVCYLTFDDGPSETVTPKILDTLEEYDVQATFFIVASQVEGNEALLQRMIQDGDTICIHANVHEYETIYASVQAYLDDFAAAYDTIYAATGYRVQGFRFPGGSNNGVLTANEDIYSAIVTEMQRRGFEYYDWNAYDGDAEGSTVPAPSELASRAVDEVLQSSRNDVIVLMHDTYGKENTATALSSIIEGLRSEGIDMLPISASTRPVHFWVNDDTPSDDPDALTVTAEPVEPDETESDLTEDDTTEDSSEDSGESEGY